LVPGKEGGLGGVFLIMAPPNRFLGPGVREGVRKQKRKAKRGGIGNSLV